MVSARTGPLLLVAAIALAACDDGAPVGDGGPLPPDNPPVAIVASAGPDMTVIEGTRVQLSAFGTRSLEGSALVSWAQIDGVGVSLSSPGNIVTTFVAPLAPATLTFRLRATNETGEAAADTVEIKVVSQKETGPLLLETPRDRVVSGAPISLAPILLGTESTDATLDTSGNCLPPGAMLPIVDGVAAVPAPLTLPCLLGIRATTADGRRSNRGAVAFYAESAELPPRTRVVPPVLVEPGAIFTLGEVADIGNDALSFWRVDGRPGGPYTPGQSVDITAQRDAGSMTFAIDRRRDDQSGGLAVVQVAVSEGFGNRAPTVSAGPDRTVAPGSTFQFDIVTSDPNGDEVALVVEQKLGAVAVAEGASPSAFVAPDDASTLLFHVQGDDGIALSAVDVVRVVVDPDAPNEPPVLELQTERFVLPAAAFTIDLTDVRDPDSGFVAGYSVTQAPQDTQQLDGLPSTDVVTTLLAGDIGDVYHLDISAFDTAGGVSSVSVTVTVEEAGPYVDPGRGDDLTGNGTANFPFASISGALDTAIRFRFPSLFLSEGGHASAALELPAGVALQGGFAFDGQGYQSPGAATTIDLAGELTLNSGGLRDVNIMLTSPDAIITLRGIGTMTDVLVEEADNRTAPLVLVGDATNWTLNDAAFVGAASTADERLVLDIHPNSLTRLDGVTVTAATAMNESIGIKCQEAIVDIVDSEVTGAANATRSVGIELLTCDAQILNTTVEGGAATDEAWGIRSTDAAIVIDSASTIIGSAGSPSLSATAASLSGPAGTGAILGSLISSTDPNPTTAIADGLAIDGFRVEIDGASIQATGVTATAVRAVASDIVAVGGEWTATAAEDATGVDGTDVDAFAVDGTEFNIFGATVFGVSLDARPKTGEATIQNASIILEANGEVQGVVAPADTLVSLLAINLSATSFAGKALAISGGAIVLNDAHVHCLGNAGPCVETTDDTATVMLRRTSIVAPAALTSGLSAAGDIDASDVFVRSGSVALQGMDDIAVNASTFMASTKCIEIENGQVDLTNSYLVCPIGLEATNTAPLGDLAANAFRTSTAFSIAQETFQSAGDLAGLGCVGCTQANSDGPIYADETGHLVDGINPLVDAAASEYASASDFDGEERPVGPAADIGCDERTELP